MCTFGHNSILTVASLDRSPVRKLRTTKGKQGDEFKSQLCQRLTLTFVQYR